MHHTTGGHATSAHSDVPKMLVSATIAISVVAAVIGIAAVRLRRNQNYPSSALERAPLLSQSADRISGSE